MRISRVEVQKRQTFLREYFTKNPSNTIREAQEALKAQFGREMKPTTVIQIRAEVKNATAVPTPVAAEVVETAVTPVVVQA